MYKAEDRSNPQSKNKENIEHTTAKQFEMNVEIVAPQKYPRGTPKNI